MRAYCVFIPSNKKQPSYYGSTRAKDKKEAKSFFAEDYIRKNNYAVDIDPEDFDKAMLEFYK